MHALFFCFLFVNFAGNRGYLQNTLYFSALVWYHILNIKYFIMGIYVIIIESKGRYYGITESTLW